MPKITIKYEHPHELTELFSKLAQMYIVPQAICNVDTPYPPDREQNKYRDILKQIFDILILKELNPHGLSEFTMEDRNKFMKDQLQFFLNVK